jgi:hypothetical protein
VHSQHPHVHWLVTFKGSIGIKKQGYGNVERRVHFFSVFFARFKVQPSSSKQQISITLSFRGQPVSCQLYTSSLYQERITTDKEQPTRGDFRNRPLLIFVVKTFNIEGS